MKVYAVRKGRKPGIYTTWADCQNQVKGFKGAEFKSFNKHSEAYEYLRAFKNDEKIVSGVMHEVDYIFMLTDRMIKKLVCVVMQL